jgi:gamma-glutamyltranspeptidase / glutathione hydrolase
MVERRTGDTSKYTKPVGPKCVARGGKAAVSTQHAITTETMLEVLENGGNAADAAVAGAMVDAVVENLFTNHAGTVTLLYWQASTRSCHQLISSGTFPYGLPVFRPLQDVGHLYTKYMLPSACIPGFMPGIGALHRRFGTKPWQELCGPAIYWAEEGFPMSQELYVTHVAFLPITGYFPEGRRLFTPNGYVTNTGDRFRNSALAETLRNLASEGSTYFTEGQWARDFVTVANRLGWGIELRHMIENPPQWGVPLKYSHRGCEIAQLAPPDAQAVLCSLTLGILEHLGIHEMEATSAKRHYLFGHVLRWVNKEIGYLHDPSVFEVPIDVWLDPQYHGFIAKVIGSSIPKKDLTNHVVITAGVPALVALGAMEALKAPHGSCEISVIDAEGNCCQLMNTLQSGGIPGQVVGGVNMIGFHASHGNMANPLSQWLVPKARMRTTLGNTMVFRDGEPFLQLGASGALHCSVPQVLSYLLDHGLAPDAAVEQVRLLPLTDDYTLAIEARVAPDIVMELASLGIKTAFLRAWDTYLGSFQLCWRDHADGDLSAYADPRYTGVADVLQTS